VLILKLGNIPKECSKENMFWDFSMELGGCCQYGILTNSLLLGVIETSSSQLHLSLFKNFLKWLPFKSSKISGSFLQKD
jgi:hypothetical protein